MRLHQPQKVRLDFLIVADMAVILTAKIQTY